MSNLQPNSEKQFLAQLNIQTRAIHVGEKKDKVTRASSPNLVMSTTFSVEGDTTFAGDGYDPNAPFVYTRWANPTVRQLEEKLANLENGEACIAFASGMSAATSLLLYELKSGDRLVISDVTYAGVREFGNSILEGLKVEVEAVDLSDLEALKKALEKPTKLVFVETPCNPIVRLTDIEAVCQIAHQAGAKVAVDATFSTPILTRPIEFGADYVVQSLTKYIGGHGDALGGAVIGTRENIEPMRQNTGIHLGGVISPFNAWLILRGVATLPMRMRVHSENAMKVASFLENHPKVKRVIYPGLASHPQHELAKRQMSDFSGMLTFQVENGEAMAVQLSEKLKIFHYAVSLGHHRSLMFYLSTQELHEASFKLSKNQLEKYREYAGDGIFRVSIGLEFADDLCRDLEQALG